MDALVPAPKVSCGFRQGKKKRKKGVHIGDIDKKPRQKKNKKASPPMEEESTPAPAVERPVVTELLLPVEPAVEPAVAPAIQPCALFVSPPALSASPPDEDDDPRSEESIAKMSPEEFATFLASLMTVVHDWEHIQTTMTHLNSIFSPDSNQPTRSTVVTPSCAAATIPPSINPLAFHSNPAMGSPVKPTYAAVKKFRSIAILTKAINEMGNSEQAALAMSTLLHTKQKDVGQLMALAAPEGTKAQVAMGIMESIAKVFARTDCLGSSSNDAISFPGDCLVRNCSTGSRGGGCSRSKESSPTKSQ
jgi:hypothetical protein